MNRELWLLVLLMAMAGGVRAQGVARHGVLITEIMADPTPAAGLPNAEYVEVCNRGRDTLSLRGWTLSDSRGTATITAAVTLPPDSCLLLCASASAALLQPLGRTAGLPGFPSLDNEGELLVLRAADGRVVHSLEYDLSWFRNPAKAEGGWSLELIDPGTPCTGAANWKASEDARGGTPGHPNSVTGTTIDDLPPRFLRAYAADSLTLLAVFDEPLDSLWNVQAGRFALQDNEIMAAAVRPPRFREVELKLQQPLPPDRVYELQAGGVADCQDNRMRTESVPVGRPVRPAYRDLVVNELLFDPPPAGADYVELYNRSRHLLDLSGLFLATRNAAGGLTGGGRVTDQPFLLPPGCYALLTADGPALQRSYLVSDERAVCITPALPTLPDERGHLVLLGGNDQVIDEVAYEADWHFPLLRERAGVSLERVDPEGISQQADNWHSAASTAGWGTPGYRNSQHRGRMEGKAMVEVVPSAFSPDNDGRDDQVLVRYRLEGGGYVANSTVFDAGGRPVRRLVRNGILGRAGHWRWDGLNDAGQPLPAGPYIVFTELFNRLGRTQRFRQAVVLKR